MADSRYRAFAMAAELGSLTRAAETLGYTQSGVSHLIKALEDELGLALLLRSRSGTAPTPEGKRLLPFVQAMLRAADAVQNVAGEIKGLQTGSMQIGTFTSVATQWLPPVLAAYTAQYPNIDVRVVNGTYSVLETALLENRLDCAFVTLPSLPEFKAVGLGADRLMAVLPKGHALSRKKELAAADLAKEPFVMPAEGSNYDIGKLFHAAGAVPRVRFDMGDDYAAIEMIRHGMGVTILPELLLAEMPLSGLCTVPIKGTTRRIGLATNRGRGIAPAVRAFIGCLQAVLPQAV